MAEFHLLLMMCQKGPMLISAYSLCDKCLILSEKPKVHSIKTSYMSMVFWKSSNTFAHLEIGNQKLKLFICFVIHGGFNHCNCKIKTIVFSVIFLKIKY